MPTDIEIARQIKLKPIAEIAAQLGVGTDRLEVFGHYKAKLPLHLIDAEKVKRCKLVLVSAISPTPAGEAWSGFRNQGWSHRRWLVSSAADGRHQPALHR